MTPTPGEHGTWEGLWQHSPGLPHTPIDEESRRRWGLPRTLLPAPEGLRQPPVFDPALKQFGRAYRAGEPVFGDEAARRAWHRARRTALDLVLAGLSCGRWAPHLVLRGSVLMATWFGEAARDPGDLDFLVTPTGWAMDGPETTGLFGDLARDTEAAARAHGGVAIDAAGRVTEDIWTYDRVPGRRMVLPWTAPGTPGGTVQLDVVFNEPLPAAAEPTELRPLGDGPGAAVLAVSPGLSLAWKLLWLVTDAYPQGKDLYDAVLLAEQAPPSYELVRDAFLAAGCEGLRPPGDWWLAALSAGEGWEHFALDYPEVAAGAADCPDRLARALAPLLAEAGRPGDGAQDRWARWLEPLVRATRARAPADPASALGALAEGGRDGLAAAVVIVREILGREALGPEEALRAVVAGDERWAHWRDHPASWRFVLELIGP
ncbi:nucleotidyl transferase AbiEii/AbiGii toxin family protein [Streptomyces hoynatensis]|uniref:Nucleotidyl transferase AbiEii/AbiGii toxin family protein n=1 Tax=Streptomyces hoynatensis TaxID=1141874 RepID=A0A3A9YUC7_9ACTN|nr:nucleotidyl transferase AbiEii/AbiGii toxin family protein [Streptomyces hoynatensis]RKN39701.1 nucleotidyl transferase AbiEii/AbiGii toxin family protein [Streptomyces hoynatensis]